MISTCPDPEILVRLGTPALGDSTYELYLEHVDGCPSCQAVLQRFVDEGMDDSTANLSSILDGHDGFPRVPGFTIERKLGIGATGVVFQARQDESERPVALKLIPGGHAAGPRERRYWLREVKAASKVRHPHVVTLYDFGEAEPWFYLVLEFIPGGSLKDRLKGPLSPRDAARFVELVALAVDKIHSEDLLHLDLKPSNILIEGDENAPWENVVPKVTDFSIARIAGEARTSLGAGMPFGTPEYMAPEQTGAFPSQVIGPASDVYALGTVLYELLTGRPPIQRNSVVETLEAIRNQEPVPPRRLNPTIPRDLETICLKCLQKEPGRRYATAAELADDLRQFLQNRPIKARPISPVERVWRWCRRNPVVAGLASVLVLTIVVGFIVLLTLLKEARARRSEAESNYAVASNALSDALKLSNVLNDGAGRPEDEPALKFLEQLRTKQKWFVQARPGDYAASDQLARIDLALIHRLNARRNYEALRPLVEECLGVLVNASKSGRSDDKTPIHLMQCYQVLIELSLISEHDLEGALSHSFRASQIFRSFDSQSAARDLILSVLSCCVQRGELLVFLGRQEEAERWLKDNRRWLDATEPHKLTDATFPELHARWLLASQEREAALAVLRAAVNSYPKNASLSVKLAELLVPEAENQTSDEKRRASFEEARRALSSVAEKAELDAIQNAGWACTLLTLGNLYQLLCQCLVELGRLDEAISALPRLVSVQKTQEARHLANRGSMEESRWRLIGRLGEMLTQGGKWDEARSLFENSLADTEVTNQQNPSDHRVLLQMDNCFQRIAAIAEKQGKAKNSIDYLRRSVRAAEERRHLVEGPDPLIRLAQSREDLAVALAKRGDSDESRSLMRANRHMLAEVPVDRDDFRMAALRVHLEYDFIRVIEGKPSEPPRPPRDRMPRRLGALAQLAALEADRLAADAWARVAVDALIPASPTGGIPFAIDESGFYLSNLMGTTSAELRRLGKFPEARRVAERLLALALILVERFPDRPAAHLALGEAHMQVYKNDWRANDRAAIERNLSLAVAATRRALAIDPKREDTRVLIEDRQRLLTALQTPKSL